MYSMYAYGEAECQAREIAISAQFTIWNTYTGEAFTDANIFLRVNCKIKEAENPLKQKFISSWNKENKYDVNGMSKMTDRLRAWPPLTTPCIL